MLDDKPDYLKSTESDIAYFPRKLPQTKQEVVDFNSAELADLEARNYKPREIHVQVSKRCNLKCTMCSWETWKSNVGVMEMPLFKKILDNAEDAGVAKIVFANAQGEPFLNPEIYEMIEMASARGFWTMVSTNGTPLNAKNCSRLARSGINNIQFSFAGYDKQTYETVYVGGKWEQVTENLKRMVAALEETKQDTSLVINGCYAVELKDIVSPNAFVARTRAYLRSIGIWEPKAQIRLQLPHNFGGNIKTGSDGTDTGSHFLRGSKTPGLCRVLKNAPGVYHDGQVTACGCIDPNGEMLIGDITKEPIAEIRRGEKFQSMVNNFVEGNLNELPLCADCDIPFYDTPEDAPDLWPNLVSLDSKIPIQGKSDLQRDLEGRLISGVAQQYIESVPGLSEEASLQMAEKLLRETHSIRSSAIETWKIVFGSEQGHQLIKKRQDQTTRHIALAPATETILENLPWFIDNFDSVRVGDNYKAGQVHHGITVETMEQLVKSPEAVDCYVVTTDTPEIQHIFSEALPPDRTIHIYDLRRPLALFAMPENGYLRVMRLVAEIEASDNPVVILGSKLLPTSEPILCALDNAGHDVFVVSQNDRMDNAGATDLAHDPSCSIYRNVLITFQEFLYLLTHLNKGRFWIHYDFFLNVGWDVDRAISAYALTTAIIEMASRPVVLGMYDVIKPVCTNMEKQAAMTAQYKRMVAAADALVLTSKSEHVAEYLRNTVALNKPVKSFYRYSYPPQAQLPRLSDTSGCRHMVGITSFLGEVYEPNRIETRNSIRSILQRGIHFHYYSANPKVVAFLDDLPDQERAFFHLETPIWDQNDLIQDMSRFDAGWLVGDEATVFADMIRQIEDRNIREIFSLFVPNGVPTSSMAYGAAGLPVFISRQIKVMTEVYPEKCCIPLDMGEVDNLGSIIARLDWDQLHKTMRAEKWRFDATHQVESLSKFLNDLAEPV